MKLKAQLEDQEHDLAIIFAGQRATVQIDGRSYDLEVHEPEDGSYLLFVDTRVYECRVNASPGSRETFAVNVGGHNYKVNIIDPRRLRSVQRLGISWLYSRSKRPVMSVSICSGGMPL